MSVSRWPLDAEPLTEEDIEAMFIDCPNEQCGRPTVEDELTECARSGAHGVELHSPACQAECLDHGSCRDEARREWQAEHGG